ncbi:sensor histidine kinase [Hyphomicrobium sp.]|uniref:sensor histidine kinase n=1 Tax=Hyphomicrobium sp. TaxID=82 RepID=UPI002D76A74C|nr:histidine kinase dimerization/phospho-acceptor domain-containing protein [Hyphomicrobium sp.]HET6390817.1 histidine kinase dimerization/phospho-acceptor domain-containing protein [Hyphomicrobium sp.]
MARTWSAPQRESFARLNGARQQAAGEAGSGAGVSRRGFILLFAGVLTTAGAIVPQLDTQQLSTLLLAAGASLAAAVVFLPARASRNRKESPRPARAPQPPSPPSAFDGRQQVRFPELFQAGPAEASLDRAAWAKLTAHMSHELRTPLNAVLGFSEIMSKEVFGPIGSNYGPYARDIHASGRILLKRAEDALAITALLTAPASQARQTSRLAVVLDEACAFSAPDLAARSISVVRDNNAGCDILGDHQAMRQLLINLIGEAVRKGAADASLRIETNFRPGAVDVSLAIPACKTGAAQDDGFGMILARTLSELSGAELMTSVTDGCCRWTVRLLPAAQHDLFQAAA